MSLKSDVCLTQSPQFLWLYVTCSVVTYGWWLLHWTIWVYSMPPYPHPHAHVSLIHHTYPCIQNGITRLWVPCRQGLCLTHLWPSVATSDQPQRRGTFGQWGNLRVLGLEQVWHVETHVEEVARALHPGYCWESQPAGLVVSWGPVRSLVWRALLPFRHFP